MLLRHSSGELASLYRSKLVKNLPLRDACAHVAPRRSTRLRISSGNATRNLSLGLLTTDAKLDLGPWKVKVYGDLVYNFHGDARVRGEYDLPGAVSTTNRLAFATGLTVGSDFEIRKKGDYVRLAEYRQVGLGSVDPNLNDGDFNISELNFRGVKLGSSYGIEPWLIFGVTYFGSSNLGGADKNVNLGVANLNTAQTIQVDLTTKF